ncbi:MAG: transketolase family protein [Desulfurococcales archaeon]|nr:transketolase family protein [Desulfurococcales archaeon]
MVVFESYRRAVSSILLELGERLEDLVVLDADTGRSTGSLAFGKKFPGRYVNVGISEQDLIGTAAGLALAGLRPVAMGFAMFLMRAFEQIRNTLARDRLNVKVIATHAGLSPHIDGASHQSLEDLALMRSIPGMTVVSPADFNSTRALVRAAVEDHVGPLYMRLGRDNAVHVYDNEDGFRIGGLRVVRDPVDIVIYAVGPMVGMSLEAARILETRGIRAGVVDVYTVKPIDSATITRLSTRTILSVTVEEHNTAGGLGGAVAEVLAEAGAGRLMRIGVHERFGTSSKTYLDLVESMDLTPREIAAKIESALATVGR